MQGTGNFTGLHQRDIHRIENAGMLLHRLGKGIALFDVVGNAAQHFGEFLAFFGFLKVGDGFFDRQTGGEHRGELAGEKHQGLQGNSGAPFVDAEHDLVKEREFAFESAFGCRLDRDDCAAFLGQLVHRHVQGVGLDDSFDPGALGVFDYICEIRHS